MIEGDVAVTRGFETHQLPRAAELFWEAFAAKLNPVMKPRASALKFLENVIDPRYAFAATTTGGELVGVAGFKTERGQFVGGELKDLQRVYGRVGGLWRGVLLVTLERSPTPGELLMDGIFVTEAGRGKGTGSALLAAIKQHAVEANCSTVRLDVIDTNPRARALYQRSGFRAMQESETGLLKHVFGFSKATAMVYDVKT